MKAKKPSRMVTKNVLLYPDEIQWLTSRARALGISRSAFVQQMVADERQQRQRILAT